MKISFCFANRLYDCDVTLTDQIGTKRYRVNMADADAAGSDTFTVDIAGTDFEMTISPRMVDFKAMGKEQEKKSWKDQLAFKLLGKLCESFEKMILRVGCKYKVTGLKEGDTVTVDQQGYVFDTFSDLTGLVPVAYMFFEPSSNGRRFELLDAFETNRKQVIRFVRGLVLVNLDAILLYPVQMSRVKRLTSNKKIYKTLTKFGSMDEAEREKMLKRQEKIMSR